MIGDIELSKGFTSLSGTMRNTTLILMRSEVYLHTFATTDEKVAIVIVDTQDYIDTSIMKRLRLKIQKLPPSEL